MGDAQAGPVIDLNCDAGEGCVHGGAEPGAPDPDEAVIPWVTSVSIACGFHAGGPLAMERAVRLAREHGVAVGAHPGFPDRAGFGRRSLGISPAEAAADLVYQVGALMGFCRAAGVTLRHVKPHGALYHQAAVDRGLARALVGAVKALDPALIIFAPAGSVLHEEAEAAGIRVAREGFADRGYDESGRLLPRGHPGALLTGEAAAAQAVRLALAGGIDTLCIHSDTPGAADTAQAVRAALLRSGVSLRPPADFLPPAPR